MKRSCLNNYEILEILPSNKRPKKDKSLAFESCAFPIELLFEIAKQSASSHGMTGKMFMLKSLDNIKSKKNSSVNEHTSEDEGSIDLAALGSDNEKQMIDLTTLSSEEDGDSDSDSDGDDDDDDESSEAYVCKFTLTDCDDDDSDSDGNDIGSKKFVSANRSKVSLKKVFGQTDNRDKCIEIKLPNRNYKNSWIYAAPLLLTCKALYYSDYSKTKVFKKGWVNRFIGMACAIRSVKLMDMIHLNPSDITYPRLRTAMTGDNVYFLSHLLIRLKACHLNHKIMTNQNCSKKCRKSAIVSFLKHRFHEKEILGCLKMKNYHCFLFLMSLIKRHIEKQLNKSMAYSNWFSKEKKQLQNQMNKKMFHEFRRLNESLNDPAYSYWLDCA